MYSYSAFSNVLVLLLSYHQYTRTHENVLGPRSTFYPSDRVQSVHLQGATSTTRPFAHGVPQGFVLGSQVFSIYAVPVAKIIRKNNLMSHFYEDDIQTYTPVTSFRADLAAALACFDMCIEEIKAWISSNFWKLNDEKTEFAIFGSASLRK